jgi:ParB family transcriptional regulator, chromosome partitioning protein
MASKLFGGLKLGELAKEAKERGEPAPQADAPMRPRVPAAELALTGRQTPQFERENILAVDPRRCRPWAYHNRSSAWYTRERCQDLIDSFPRDGQREPALARRLTNDANFDFELIYGMRRRYAAESTHSKLKVRLTEADDARCAVLMHIENADRQDITPMERALSFQQQLEAKVFASQESMAEAFGLGAPQVTKMLKAAQIFRHGPIEKLLPDRTQVPVAPAYDLATRLELPGAKEVVLKAAQNWIARGEGAGTPSVILKRLLASLDRSRALEPVRREYDLGPNTRMTATRNGKGKVTLAFPKGLHASDREGLMAALDKLLKDLT